MIVEYFSDLFAANVFVLLTRNSIESAFTQISHHANQLHVAKCFNNKTKTTWNVDLMADLVTKLVPILNCTSNFAARLHEYMIVLINLLNNRRNIIKEQC